MACAGCAKRKAALAKRLAAIGQRIKEAVKVRKPDDFCPFCKNLREDCIDAQAHCTPRRDMTPERMASLRDLADKFAAEQTESGQKIRSSHPMDTST